jgi:hypothetical protein
MQSIFSNALIRGGSKTHRLVGHKARDAVVSPPPPIPISALFAVLGWDIIETDQVVVIAAKTTITDAVMILRMKCIVFPCGFSRVQPANRHLGCQGG